jgi:serine/threonine protein kinase
LYVPEDESNLPISYAPSYASPQRIFVSGNAFQNDGWSLRVRLFVAVSGIVLFEGEGTEYEENFLNENHNFQFVDNLHSSSELVSLLSGTFEKNHGERFKIDECLAHQFFESESFFD